MRAQRRRTQVLALGTALALAVALIVVLSWFRPLIQPTLILVAGPVDGPTAIPQQRGDLAALQHLNGFQPVAGGVKVLDISQALATLRGGERAEPLATGPLLISLSSRVWLDPQSTPDGQPSKRPIIHLGSADGPGLDEFLRVVSSRGSSDRLLILDLYPPPADPRWGSFAPEAVPQLVNQAAADSIEANNADESTARSLAILVSCAPDQRPVTSDALERSVFGLYLEQGLRGAADRSGDGRITARELAAFTTNRVQHWSRSVRGVTQSPTYHDDPATPSMPLVLVPRQIPAPAGLPKTARGYPEWLTRAWTERDALIRSGAGVEAPRPLALFAAAILQAERDWRSGLESARVEADLADRLASIRARIAPTRAISHPAPRSLAQEEWFGHAPDAAILAATRAAYTKRPRREPDAKPGVFEAAEAHAIADFFDPAKLQIRSDFDLAHAVFRVAVEDSNPSFESISFLRQILASHQPRPAYAETLALFRLAERPRADWSADLASQALALTRDGELAQARPSSLAGGSRNLDEAARLRHEAEVLFHAPGYGSVVEVAQRFAAARAATRVALTRSAAIDEATRLADDAARILPAAANLLEVAPELERLWLDATDAAAQMFDQLDQTWVQGASRPPGLATDQGDRRDQDGPTDRIDLTDEIDALRVALASFGPEAISAWTARVARPGSVAEPIRLREILALLATDLPVAGDRANLWKAGIEIERRLVAATMELDTRDGSRIVPLVDDPARPVTNAFGPGAEGRRERVAARLRALGGVKASGGDRAIRLLAPWIGNLPIDRPATDPTRALRTEQFLVLRRWLAARAAFTARDVGGTDLDRESARDFAMPGEDPVVGAVAIDPPSPAGFLDAAHSSATLRISLGLPAGTKPGPAYVEVAVANQAWLELEPGSPWPGGLARLPATGTDSLRFSLELGPRPVEIPVLIRLRADKEPARTPLPPGLVIRARIGTWTSHRLVPLRVEPGSYRLQANLTPDPTGQQTGLTEVRLRVAQGKVSTYLHVKNPGIRDRVVQVELVDRRGAIAGASASLMVRAGESARVNFGPPAPKPDDGFVDVHGPLTVRLTGTDAQGGTITRTIPCRLTAPADFVRVVSTSFEPTGTLQNGRSRLNILLRAVGPIAGPPCPVELVVAADRIPGLVAPGEGTYSDKLTKAGDEAILTVDGIKIDDREENPGHLDLTIDGMTRAISLQAQLGAWAGPTRPAPESRPTIRLRANGAQSSTGPLSVGIELDSPPENGRVVVELGRYVGNDFRVESVDEVESDRGRIRINPRGPDGALVFEATLREPGVSLQIGKIRGRRLIQARVLDELNNLQASAELPIVFDDRAPAAVELVDPPKYGLRGGAVLLRARGSVPQSGIKEVAFFLGRPAGGKRPPGVVAVPGRPVDPDRTIWAAALPLNEAKLGPVDVSVEFVAGVGLGSFATATLTVVEAIPVEPGKIRGTVKQGDRPQSGLAVRVLDDKGAEKKQAKTNDLGGFEITDLAPGTYRVVCTKPTPPTVGSAQVTVKPGETATAEIGMFYK